MILHCWGHIATVNQNQTTTESQILDYKFPAFDRRKMSFWVVSNFWTTFQQVILVKLWNTSNKHLKDEQQDIHWSKCNKTKIKYEWIDFSD